MINKLELIEERFDELSRQLINPDIYSDPATAARVMKEQKELLAVVDAFRAYKKAEGGAKEARALLDSPLDPDFREMAQEEYNHCREQMDLLYQTLKVLLLPKDPNDSKNVIVEIRAGAGGEEAALFGYVLYRMYSMYAAAKNWKCEILNINETELGGIKEISFAIEGNGAYSRLKFEMGVHRVQRVPETESSGRIHTSTVTVAILPEAEEVDVEINPADLQFDTFRSGGAGGQHVNKTESAVRIIHVPTGLVVECQDERSQHKNRDRAMKIMRSKLYEMKMEEQNSKIAAERKGQVGTGDRSERIRTYNYPQGRVTDHRVGLTLHRLEAVLNGDLDEIFDTLATVSEAERLRAAGDSDE